ncbi:hypothetical protein KM043_014500 [Ampulex compressa]|nr:hypothetical protein KM043_014500 [Ampulex compressa]
MLFHRAHVASDIRSRKPNRQRRIHLRQPYVPHQKFHHNYEGVKASSERTSNILRIKAPVPKYNNVPSAMEHRDYNETSFSPLSKDLTLLQSTIDAIEDSACRGQCQIVLANLANLTTWAVRFYDSSGKFPSGLLAASVYELGNFDECLEIGHEVETTSDIRGQYCLNQVDMEVPETYQKQRGSVWELFKKSESLLKLKVTTPEKYCYTRNALFFDVADIVYMCVILVLLCIVIVSTICHCLNSRNGRPVPENKLYDILLSFSAVTTMKKIFKHANVHIVAGPVVNKSFSERVVGRLYSGLLLNHSLVVDTFLLISGFLFCFLLLRELDEKKTLNISLLYVFRYIRLTPAYLVMIGFYVTWLTKLDMGPLWFKMENEKERCLSSWWANILYINNYVNEDKICMFQSWYLCVDTQLYVLAPFIIYPLWRWKKIGTFILLCATGISIGIPFTVTLLYNLDPTLMVYPHELTDLPTNEYFKFAYIKTHMKAEAYCVGLIGGYVVHRIQTSEYKLSKKTVKFGWLLSVLSFLVSMYSITIFYGLRRNYTALEAAIYSSLHRILWSISVAWVIIASITNNAGYVKTFLEWPYFKPISKLSYCAYLVDGLVELYSMSTSHTPQYENVFTLFAMSLSHVIFAFMGAIFLAIISESPILGVERILLKKDKQPTNHTGSGNGTAACSQG